MTSATKTNIKKLATKLVSYLAERARVEGVPMEFDAGWFRRNIHPNATGYAGHLFGIHIHVDEDTSFLIRDDQEPRPGFLEDWKKRHGDPAVFIPDLGPKGDALFTAHVGQWMRREDMELMLAAARAEDAGMLN